MVADWSSFLSEGTDEQEQALLRRHESMGRPLGSEKSVRKLERTIPYHALRYARGRVPHRCFSTDFYGFL